MTDDVDLTPHQGETYDAPNQEVVGVGKPWEEGTGGEPGDTGVAVEESAAADQPDGEAAAGNTATGDDLDAMTKDDLIGYAQERGVSPANHNMTKQELVDAIRAHEAGG